MYHSILLVYGYLLKVSRILLWHNVRLLWKNVLYQLIVHNLVAWRSKIWRLHRSAELCNQFQNFIITVELIKVLFHPMVITDAFTHSYHQMLDSNLQSVMTLIWIPKTTSWHGQRVKPDILVSIYDFSPGSFPHFRNPYDLLYGLHKHVLVTHVSSTISCMFYFQATR